MEYSEWSQYLLNGDGCARASGYKKMNAESQERDCGGVEGGCSQVISQFTVETGALLRVEGAPITNYTGTAGVNWYHPRETRYLATSDITVLQGSNMVETE